MSFAGSSLCALSFVIPLGQVDMSSAPPLPPTSSGSQAGWWCCVTWHGGPVATLQAEDCSGDIGMVVLSLLSKSSWLVKTILINSKRHTRGPNNTSHHLGTLCSFVCGGERFRAGQHVCQWRGGAQRGRRVTWCWQWRRQIHLL
jgi:hypothetical protein